MLFPYPVQFIVDFFLGHPVHKMKFRFLHSLSRAYLFLMVKMLTAMAVMTVMVLMILESDGDICDK